MNPKVNILILNWNGSKYSSGEYIVSLKTDNYSKTDKITLIK